MEVAKKGFALILLVHVCSFDAVSRSSDMWMRYDLNTTGKVYMSEDISRNSDLLVFSTCNQTKFPGEIDCDIIAQKLPNLRRPSASKTCHLNFVLPRKRNLVMFRLPFEITFFKDIGKILFSWMEVNTRDQLPSKNITIVNISDCTMKHLNFVYPETITSEKTLISNLVVYPDHFDVIANDNEKCHHNDGCRITYDLDGQQIGEAATFAISDSRIIKTQSVLANTSLQGFYVQIKNLSTKPTHVSVRYLNESGGITKLKTGEENVTITPQPVTSTAYNMFTICWKKYTANQTPDIDEINCNQFNIGVAEMNRSSTLNYSERVKAMAVHNLANGGFLLVTVACDRSSLPSCEYFTVTKVDKGQKSLETAVLGIRCSSLLVDLTIKIHERPNEYCFFFACPAEWNRTNNWFTSTSLYYVRKCIAKSNRLRRE